MDPRRPRADAVAVRGGRLVAVGTEADAAAAAERDGRVVAHRIDPLASALGRDIHFALHSDCPVTPVAPLMSVWSAVNRITREGRVIGPEQRIAIGDALRAFTLDAAYLAFEDRIKGSLVPGKLADFVVLERDPLIVAPEDIRDVAIAQTVVGGEVISADGADEGRVDQHRARSGDVTGLDAAQSRSPMLPTPWLL